MLLPDTEEYTCGIFKTGCGEIRTVVINRKLQGDVTGSGIVVQNDYIEKYLKQIAVLLDLQGSINVQLRLTERGPVAFEINPRFSSTVVFRHLMGFQDLIWSLKELRGLPLEPFRQITPGLKLYRGACEYIVGSPIPSEIAKAHL
jgi:carbamoyl-phosphate synthase large subunit